MVAALTGCGLSSSPHSPAPKGAVKQAVAHRVEVPVVHWHQVALGGQAQLKKGLAISSVLPGPSGRIYYGTANPWGSSNIIGWYSPKTGHSSWRQVPSTAAFPRQSTLQANHLTSLQSSYWGAVDLIVGGAYTIWYRHWGYVGGLTAQGHFVPGDYAVVGPTAHKNFSTVSIQTAFGQIPEVRIMNTQTKKIAFYPLPSDSSPIAVAFDQKPSHIWLMDPNTLWRLNASTHQWTPISTAPLGGFFVSMGQFPSGLWVVNANGNIGVIRQQQHLIWIGHVPMHPIAAQTASVHGLWLASKHHLALWLHGHPVKEWSWPRLNYPFQGLTRASSSPNWPPLPHIQEGASHVLDIGYGPFIGQAYLTTKTFSRSSSNK